MNSGAYVEKCDGSYMAGGKAGGTGLIHRLMHQGGRWEGSWVDKVS